MIKESNDYVRFFIGSSQITVSAHARWNLVNKSSPSHLGRVHCYPSWQRMYSSAVCASCAMSTVNSSYTQPQVYSTSIPLQSLDTSVPIPQRCDWNRGSG